MGLSGPFLPTIILLVLAIPIFLFTLFPLISSTSNGVSNIYILTAKWGSTSLHIGYYGVCWMGYDKFPTICTGTTAKNAQKVAAAYYGNSSPNDSAIRDINFVLDLQRNVFVAFMTAGGIAWLISLFLVGMIILAKGNAGPSWRVAAKTVAGIASLLMVASAWATSQAVAALESVDKASGWDRSVAGGKLLIALQWVAALLSLAHLWAVGRVTKGESSEQIYTYNIGR